MVCTVETRMPITAGALVDSVTGRYHALSMVYKTCTTNILQKNTMICKYNFHWKGLKKMHGSLKNLTLFYLTNLSLL